MPLIFQEEINTDTHLGIWKIEETEDFFKKKVPLSREVTHPHKRLQHLAGRYLLQALVPDFPYHLIAIADTRKPFLLDEAYHFSISHCGDYAATIVSKSCRVGIDIELPTPKVKGIQHKFINEQERFQMATEDTSDLIRIWSAKEAVFKWYGLGKVDFKDHIRLSPDRELPDLLHCHFQLTQSHLEVHSRFHEPFWLSFIYAEIDV